jgi:hypothetical protein
MGTFLPGVHTSPDIWAILRPDRTGFTLLTRRAKAWAVTYNDSNAPTPLDSMLWVSTPIGSQILQDIADKTDLNVLIDNMEDQQNED